MFLIKLDINRRNVNNRISQQVGNTAVHLEWEIEERLVTNPL